MSIVETVKDTSIARIQRVALVEGAGRHELLERLLKRAWCMKGKGSVVSSLIARLGLGSTLLKVIMSWGFNREDIGILVEKACLNREFVMSTEGSLDLGVMMINATMSPLTRSA